MLVITYHYAGDLRPEIRCAVCGMAVELASVFLLFPALSQDCRESPVYWVHQRCADGHGAALTSRNRYTLWKATDVLASLWRQTEERRTWGAEVPGRDVDNARRGRPKRAH